MAYEIIDLRDLDLSKRTHGLKEPDPTKPVGYYLHCALCKLYYKRDIYSYTTRCSSCRQQTSAVTRARIRRGGTRIRTGNPNAKPKHPDSWYENKRKEKLALKAKLRMEAEQRGEQKSETQDKTEELKAKKLLENLPDF